MIISEAETNLSFSRRKEVQFNLESSCLFLSSNLARIPVYTRFNETKKYKSQIRIGRRIKSCTNLSDQK